jgi:metal transporter CNNM
MGSENEDVDDGDDSFALPMWASYMVIAVLIMLSGLFSGLTLGLLSLDMNGLKIIIESNDAKEAALARTIEPIRKNGNLLLCTLLLGNVAVNALLSILMANLTSGLVGFLLSTIIIVIFGEIVPQASCSRYPLQIGAFSVPLVKVFLVLLCVVTYPLASILDWALGQELGTIYTTDRLIALLNIQICRYQM